MGVLGVSYPPSAAVFTRDSMQIMRGIVSFLQNQDFPLFLNVYPYFAYTSNPSNIRLGCALFNFTDVVYQDGNLQYKNLFYAMVDSMIWAVENAGGSNVEIVVSETGWPSAGNAAVATVEYAKMTHIFAMLNEDTNPEAVERNFGIYRPDLTEVYHVNWPPTGSCDIER
ncbi:hypothetical protein MKX03_004127 [Papaver bracteatum]|nr:hypothetical protein MKX03_004127 [Papaver bracteatum]